MSQATTIDKTEKDKQSNGLRLPFDPLIEWVARKIGGSKYREFERFMRFGFVGVLGAILDVGLSTLMFLTILPPTTPDGETQLFWNTIIATTLSFAVAITSNFFWNRYWTYPDSRSRSLLRQLFLFAFICTVGWLARLAWLSFAVEPFGDFVRSNTTFDPELAYSLGASLAVFGAIFIVMIWNFGVNRLWTFNDVE